MIFVHIMNESDPLSNHGQSCVFKSKSVKMSQLIFHVLFYVILIFIFLITCIHFVNLREKFSPGPGFEPGSPALHADALTN